MEINFLSLLILVTCQQSSILQCERESDRGVALTITQDTQIQPASHIHDDCEHTNTNLWTVDDRHTSTERNLDTIRSHHTRRVTRLE